MSSILTQVNKPSVNTSTILNNEASPKLINSKTLSAKNPKNKSIYEGQFSIYWLFSSLLSLWFTLYKGAPLLFDKETGPALFFHLIFCTTITIQCIINLYFVPSMGPRYRELHKFIGKFCFLTTFLSTLFGLITTWNERYSGINSFSVGISIGGLFQTGAMIGAIYYIRKKNLKRHIYCTTFVFYLGCLIPAYMRLPYLLQLAAPKYWDLIATFIAIAFKYLAYFAAVSKKWY